MMKYRRIPEETVRRMPRYLRAFSTLGGHGREFLSSRQLADYLHLNPPQIRKDLSYFGDFGTRGVGYPISQTAEQIRKILKLDVAQKAVLIGAGRLGTAIASYPGFAVFGFNIAAIFDNAPAKIGKKIAGLTIQDVAQLVAIRKSNIHLAILAIPGEAAQQCADTLVQAGVRGILNLSPCWLRVPKRVKIVSIDLAMEMGTLPYYIK
jgi:redox-sensing transcriptional repressor